MQLHAGRKAIGINVSSERLVDPMRRMHGMHSKLLDLRSLSGKGMTIAVLAKVVRVYR